MEDMKRNNEQEITALCVGHTMRNMYGKDKQKTCQQ